MSPLKQKQKSHGWGRGICSADWKAFPSNMQEPSSCSSSSNCSDSVEGGRVVVVVVVRAADETVEIEGGVVGSGVVVLDSLNHLEMMVER